MREVMLSHVHNRVFQPHQLTAPRGFISEDWRWITQKQKRINQANGATYNGNNSACNATNHVLVLEIGAGKGKHAIDYAVANPTHQIIAIERTKAKFSAFAKSVTLLRAKDKTQAKGEILDNLYPVHADAIAWTVFALPPHCLHRIYLLYPNPEPSNPNQQWLNMPFFEFLLSRLRDNGQVILASNIPAYIDNAYQKAMNIWKLPTQLEPVPANSQRTHFEIKYLARGELCQQLRITKPIDYQTRFDRAERFMALT